MKTDLKGMAELVAGHIPKRMMIIPLGNWKHVESDLYLGAFKDLLKDITPDKNHLKFLGHEQGSGGFRSVKSRIKTCILNMLYLLDFSGSRLSDALKAELECMRQGFQQRTLTAFYLRPEGIEITKKLYHIAEKFRLAAPMLQCLATLRKEATENGRHDELEELHQKSALWRDWQTAENKAMEYYELMEVQFAKSVSQKPWLAEKAFGWAKLVGQDMESFDSPVLYYEKQRLMYAGHHCAKAYRSAIAEMETLEGYYTKHQEFAGDTRYAEIAYHKMNCYMHLKDYTAGQNCARACLASFWIGSSNRLFFMELYFMFAMQAAEYEKAKKIISDAKAESGYKKLSKVHKQVWQLHKTYQEYATGMQSNAKPFDAKIFIGDYKALTDDKRGHNAAIYIMAWAMQVRYSKATVTGSREALKKYRARYLSENQDHRLNIFIKLMETADRLDYDYQNVLEQTKSLIKELENIEVEGYAGNFEGVEIIPLERLWNLVMEDMKG